MKRDDNSLDSTLDRYMGQAGEPPAGQVACSVETVWERLRPEAEYATPPAREIGMRRTRFPVAAVVVVATAAIGLYAVQRAGLLQAILPSQQPPPPQLLPALQSQATSVNPAPATEPATTEAVVVGSKEQIDGKYSRNTTPTAPLAFEVVSFRPIPPRIPTGGGTWAVSEGRFRTERGFVRGVIELAYDVRAGQVKGGPDWIDREPYDFDFDARVGSGAAGPVELRLLLQTFLTERFKLASHFDTEEATVYTLVVAKNGPKLQNSKGGQPYGNWTGREQVTLSNIPLSGLTNILTSVLDNAPVLDETGLTGNYDLSLEFTRPRDPRPIQGDSPPDLFTALQEQLGLELHATKRQIDVVVIDHMERPSEN